MTSNNAGEIADLTFTFTPSTTLGSGIFYVEFPTGFSVASRVVTGLDFIAGTDISVTVLSVQLPMIQKVYGPIAIMTRASSTGNIIDINKQFTNIPIAGPMPKVRMNSLTIAYEDIRTTVITSACNLLFKFELSQDL